jgi:hypothetical protein
MDEVSLRFRRAVPVLAAVSLLLTPVQQAAAWESAHGDGANSGFADVATIPAERPRTISGIGTIAPGAGPVVAPDGTVYLGNKEGQLISFQADGTRGWTQSIAPGFSIVASPVLDSQGAIYVVGTRRVRNDQTDPPLIRDDSSLYKFTAAGVLAWQTPFPNGFQGPTVSAPPNLYRVPGDSDVIMVPADYRNALTGGYDTRLVAFSITGAILGDVKVKSVVYQAYGSSDMPLWCVIPPMMLGCLLGSDFNPSGAPYVPEPATTLPEGTAAPRPGVAIVKYRSVITPFILVSNQWHDFVAYSFDNRQFRELFRVHDESRVLLSPPMVMPDGHTIVAASGDSHKGKVVFLGPNGVNWPPINGPVSYAAATLLADGRVALVERGHKMAILNGKSLERSVELPGESIASAAASRNHVFVSTAGSFITYDPATWVKLAEIFWMGGGTVTPAIGPFGHVYGVASNVLFVFPPPIGATVGPKVAEPGAPAVNTDPGQPVATQAREKFNAPTTPVGQRLFACQDLDGDNCGKSASKAVAQAFCQQKGFAKVDGFDTETRKGAASRLDGQLCSKTKCKVFDEIVCEN